MKKELIYYITTLTEDSINEKVDWYKFIGHEGKFVYTAEYFELKIVINEIACLLIRHNKEGEKETMGFEKEKLSQDEQDAWTILLDVIKYQAKDI